MDSCPDRLSVNQQPGALSVRVQGRATIFQSSALRRQAEAGQRQGGALLVDLRHCTYIDSTFLGTLLCLQRELGRAGGQLQLISPSAECRQILAQMGVLDLLCVVEMSEPADMDWQP